MIPLGYAGFLLFFMNFYIDLSPPCVQLCLESLSGETSTNDRVLDCDWERIHGQVQQSSLVKQKYELKEGELSSMVDLRLGGLTELKQGVEYSSG